MQQLIGTSYEHTITVDFNATIYMLYVVLMEFLGFDITAFDIQTRGRATRLSVEILQLNNIPFEN